MDATNEAKPMNEPNNLNEPINATQREWIYRGVAGVVSALILWAEYRYRYDVLLLISILPLLVGALVATLRLELVSAWVNSIENWLKRGSAKAASSEGKFARFVQRPFFGIFLLLWRVTRPIPDIHVQAGIRLSVVIYACWILLDLVVISLYILVALAVLIISFMIFMWILSHAGSGNNSPKTITRETTDWFGRPKQEHFDESGEKIGESRVESDWLGRPKIVHEDAEGNYAGESRSDTDWLGHPKTVHSDTEGEYTGESTPECDWLGNPIHVHKNAEGEVVGESREETDIFGNQQTVRYDK